MPARAERFFDADLAGALLHGHQHDVHEADAGDAQRERADHGEQHLQRDGQDAELAQLRSSGWPRRWRYGPRAEVVRRGEGLAQRSSQQARCCRE